MPRILFCLKHREASWGQKGYFLSSGLRNSVRFVVEMLNLLGIEAKWVECIDNNYIDREVAAFRPTHVIIEAFWVVPEKFDILKKLHPTVTWAVRNHSEIPFLANEGIAMGWIAGYLSRGVEVSCNAPRAVSDMQAIGTSMGYPNLVSYTPNYYPVSPNSFSQVPKPPVAGDTVRVGCFGAIRPLKNHLTQAVAALRYAYAMGKKLEFHVNATRVEGGANPALNNLRGLFANTHRATLVEQPWLDHGPFLNLMREMDFLLQVSFSETFNIVSADAVSVGVPVIASREVPWLGSYAIADPNDSNTIFNQMIAVQKGNKRQRLINQWQDLSNYCAASQQVWWQLYGFGPLPERLRQPVVVSSKPVVVGHGVLTKDAVASRKPKPGPHHHKPEPPKPHHPPHPHPHPYY